MHAEEIVERYLRNPSTGIAGNEYYGIDTPEDAACRAQARQEFFDNPDMRWPRIEYPRLTDDSAQNIRELQGLLGELEADENQGANEAYELMASKLAELYRVAEIKRKISYVNEQAVKVGQSRERAAQMSSEVYRLPSPADFATILAGLQHDAEVKSPGIAAYLSDRTEKVEPRYERSALMLTDETIRVVRGDLAAILPLADLHVPEKAGGYTPSESVAFFQHTLEVVGMDDWRALLSEGRALETSIARKQIEIGRNRDENFTAERLYALEMHEVIGHGWVGDNSLHQENPFLRLMMPGYRDFDEGRATALEQIVTGVKRIPGEQYCLSIGLQLGMDRGGEKRDFRDVFEILYRRELLKKVDPTSEKAMRQARNTAYQQVLRTTRGGALDTRDLSYFEGGKRANAWFNRLATIEDDEIRREVLRWSFSGRFDPTRRDHVELFIDQAAQNARAYIMELVCENN